ncbi:MAG: cytochrome c oxidase accessory protein CcoG [Myxococcales bacterium]|nr:cytochrome c oxidase accessory protein CcoG [Myxococcales bacterium]
MTIKLPVVEEPASSLRSDGSRNYVHPADVKGRFTRLRYIIFAVLIAIYVTLPFVKVGGHPAVFMDIVNRRFYLFGGVFNAQDFWLMFFLLSGVGLTLLILTAIKGRLWCGYACPQTVFLEGAFRRVERLIEGPRAQRLRRNAAGFTFDKLWRKFLKHALYLVLALLLSHVFISYFVSLPSVVDMVQRSPAEHPTAFTWVVVMSAILYFNFSWFREQLCLIICPYGRLQSTMTDRDTMVIGYDFNRGEPRGKASDPSNGDCVDCKRCVVVCPTGIDIRNGLQMECVGCAACVDACDEIMDKLGRDEGLVRYDSLNGLEGKPKHFGRPRLFFYGGIATLWLLGTALAFSQSVAFEANVLRLEGAPFMVVDAKVRNSLRVHLVNKTGDKQTFIIEPESESGIEYIIPQQRIELKSLGSTYLPILAILPQDKMRPGLKLQLTISMEGRDDRKASRLVEAPFVGPGS